MPLKAAGAFGCLKGDLVFLVTVSCCVSLGSWSWGVFDASEK